MASNFFVAGGAALTSDNMEWETPPELYEAVDAIWHFDLDPCASDENHLCEDYFTADDDGLTKDWGGRRVFCNPPYGRAIGKWVEKAAKESIKPSTVVVVLCPARTDTAYWHDWVVPYASEVSFLRGRVKYRLHGKELNSSPFPSCLIRFGGSLPKTARPEALREERLF